MSPEERKILEADGYLDLELPGRALEVLDSLDSTSRAKLGAAFDVARGETLRQLGRFEEAIEHLERARRDRPKDISLYINLGWCFKRSGKLSRAIAILHKAEQVCRRFPTGEKSEVPPAQTLPLVLYNLSCYYSLAGEKLPMLEFLRAAIDLDETYRSSVADEPDFDPFRDDPELRELLIVRV